MCFVLECRTGFFAMLIADMLSTKMGTLSKLSPKYLGATASSGNILSFCGGKLYASLLARRTKTPKMYQEIDKCRMSTYDPTDTH